MLFAGWEVCIGKNCAQDRGHSFSQYGRPRPANNVFIFFSLENYFYY